MKIKSGLYKDYNQDTKDQERLREKYKEPDEKIRIVEKPMVGKFIARLIGDIVRIVCQVALIVLAAVGMIALLYPPTRADLILIANDILRQIKIMLPF